MAEYLKEKIKLLIPEILCNPIYINTNYTSKSLKKLISYSIKKMKINGLMSDVATDHTKLISLKVVM